MRKLEIEIGIAYQRSMTRRCLPNLAIYDQYLFLHCSAHNYFFSIVIEDWVRMDPGRDFDNCLKRGHVEEVV